VVKGATTGLFFNTVGGARSHGSLVVWPGYRKLHLYDAFGQKESDWVAPGPIEEPETFEFGDFRMGLRRPAGITFPR
jgi:hypothetical protein